jgi:HicA toxin of bacterial toxin-antitoxin,
MYMTAKQRRTLKAVFAIPTRANVRFSDVAALIVALGGEVREGAGSRVAFELKGRRLYVHRPHPGREAKRYQVEEVREFLRSLEIQP